MFFLCTQEVLGTPKYATGDKNVPLAASSARSLAPLCARSMCELVTVTTAVVNTRRPGGVLSNLGDHCRRSRPDRLLSMTVQVRPSAAQPWLFHPALSLHTFLWDPCAFQDVAHKCPFPWIRPRSAFLPCIHLRNVCSDQWGSAHGAAFLSLFLFGLVSSSSMFLPMLRVIQAAVSLSLSTRRRWKSGLWQLSLCYCSLGHLGKNYIISVCWIKVNY